MLIEMVERGLVPDPLVRFGVRRLLRDRLRKEEGGEHRERLLRSMSRGPIAVSTLPTNAFDQQYHLFTLAGNFLLLEPQLLTAAHTFRLGEFDSACTPGNVGTVLATADAKASPWTKSSAAACIASMAPATPPPST